jgi:hypothetical protein
MSIKWELFAGRTSEWKRVKGENDGVNMIEVFLCMHENRILNPIYIV